MRALCTGTKSRIGFWLAVSLVVATAGLAAQSAGPKIRAVWSSSGGQGGVLNVSVSGLPPGAQVEVTVVDQTSGGKTESPVGTPPGTADGQGNWPGALAGSQVGYPDTSTDPGGTKYVVSVKVNGKTGPAMEVRKPDDSRSVISVISTLGGILLTDALGITGVDAGLPAYDGRGAPCDPFLGPGVGSSPVARSGRAAFRGSACHPDPWIRALVPGNLLMCCETVGFSPACA